MAVRPGDQRRIGLEDPGGARVTLTVQRQGPVQAERGPRGRVDTVHESLVGQLRGRENARRATRRVVVSSDEVGLRPDSRAAATRVVPYTTPGGNPVIAVPGLTPRSPTRVVFPVFDTCYRPEPSRSRRYPTPPGWWRPGLPPRSRGHRPERAEAPAWMRPRSPCAAAGGSRGWERFHHDVGSCEFCRHEERPADGQTQHILDHLEPHRLAHRPTTKSAGSREEWPRHCWRARRPANTIVRLAGGSESRTPCRASDRFGNNSYYSGISDRWCASRHQLPGTGGRTCTARCRSPGRVGQRPAVPAGPPPGRSRSAAADPDRTRESRPSPGRYRARPRSDPDARLPG